MHYNGYANGEKQWSHLYSKSGSDYTEDLQEALDSAIILVGADQTQNEDSNFFIMKMDAKGNIEWAKEDHSK